MQIRHTNSTQQHSMLNVERWTLKFNLNHSSRLVLNWISCWPKLIWAEVDFLFFSFLLFPQAFKKETTWLNIQLEMLQMRFNFQLISRSRSLLESKLAYHVFELFVALKRAMNLTRSLVFSQTVIMMVVVVWFLALINEYKPGWMQISCCK